MDTIFAIESTFDLLINTIFKYHSSEGVGAISM